LAEQVEITNVGGEGLASEATLQNLLAAMRDLGGEKGKSAAAKAQKLYTQAQKDGIKIIDTEADSREKNTENLKDNTSKLQKFGQALSDAAVSGLFAVGASLKNLTTELMFGGDELSDFAKHIPIVGGHLSLLTGMIDSNMSAFRELSAVGARFGDGLNDIRAASAAAAMPLDEFVNLVSENSMVMKMFGSDVASGAKSFAAMSKELRDGPGKALMGLGFTSTELNELLVDYADIQAGAFTRDRIQGRITAKNAAEFGEQLNALSAATGKRRDQIMEEIKAQQADIRIRAAMSRYTGEEGERFRANIGTVSGISKGLADALVDFDDGIPTNESTRRLMQFSDTFAQFGDDVENMNPRELNNFVVGVRQDLEEYARANNTTVEELSKSIPGLESVFGIVGETAHMAEMSLEEFAEVQRKAAEEANRNEGLKQLGETVRQFRGALLDAFIEGGALKTITTEFDKLATSLSDFVKSPAFKEGLENLTKTITTFVSNFQNFDLKTALFGGKKGDELSDGTVLENDVAGLFGGGEGGGSWITDSIKGLFSDFLDFEIPWGTLFVGGLIGIGAAIAAPVLAIPAGIAAAITAVFGIQALKDLLAGAWDALTAAFTWTADVLGDAVSGISGLFSTAWETVKGWFTFGEGETFSISEIATNMWNTVTGWFGMEGTDFSISALGTMAWETVKGWFSLQAGIVTGLADLAIGAWNTVTGWFGFEGINFSISELASNAWETVKGFFSFGGGEGEEGTSFSITNLLSDAWATITGFFSLENFELPSISSMFQGIIDAVKGFFTFDFEMPNFKAYLPKWLGGEGKSLFGGGDDVASATISEPPDVTPAAEGGAALADAQSAIATFANLDGLQNNLDILKTGLDVNTVLSYTNAMERLVEVLGELNEELAKDNKFGPGTGENAGSVLAKMDSVGGGGAGGEEVNSSLQEILAVLRAQNTKTNQIEVNTRARGLDISRTVS